MFHDVSLCHFFWFKMIMGVYSSFLQPWLHHGRSHILRSTFVGRGVWPSSPQLSSMTFLSCHFSSMASSSAASLDRSSLWTAGMLQRGRFHRKTSDFTVQNPYGTQTWQREESYEYFRKRQMSVAFFEWPTLCIPANSLWSCVGCWPDILHSP